MLDNAKQLHKAMHCNAKAARCIGDTDLAPRSGRLTTFASQAQVFM